MESNTQMVSKLMIDALSYYKKGGKYKYQQMIFDTNKNTNKKRRKWKNWMEQLGRAKLSNPSICKGLMLIYGIIWNR